VKGKTLGKKRKSKVDSSCIKGTKGKKRIGWHEKYRGLDGWKVARVGDLMAGKKGWGGHTSEKERQGPLKVAGSGDGARRGGLGETRDRWEEKKEKNKI